MPGCVRRLESRPAHGKTPTGRARAGPGGQRPLLHRLRQRRVVDLLRARPRRVLRARPDAGRLHHHRGSSSSAPPRATPRRPRCSRRPAARRASRGARSTSSGRSSPPGRGCSPTRSRSPSRRSSCRTTSAASSSSPRRCGPARATSSPACVVIALLAVGQRRRRARSRPAINVDAGGRRLPHPAAAGAGRRDPRLLARACWCDNVALGVAPDVEGLHPRDPDRDARLHGHRDGLEHGRGGARTRSHTIPAAINRVRLAVFAIYFTLPGGRALRAAGHAGATASTRRSSALDRGGGRLRRRPGARGRQADRPRDLPGARPRSTSACSRRRSSSWPRTRASSASRGSSTRWASTARCPTRCAACTRATARRGSGSSSSRRRRDRADPAGPGDAARQRSTRSARCSRFTMAHAAVARLRATRPDLERPYRGPGNVRIGGYDAPLFALVGGCVHRDRVRGDRRARTSRSAAIGAGWLRRSGMVVYVAFRRRQGLDLVVDPQGGDRPAGRRPRGGVRLRARPRRRRRVRRAD